jgi:hypothetical protein
LIVKIQQKNHYLRIFLDLSFFSESYINLA